MKRIAVLSLIMGTIGFVLCTSYVCAASLDDEARKVVEDYFITKKIGVICGDNFYISLTNHDDYNVFDITEYTGFSFIAKPQKLTYADNLNRIQWKGSGFLTSKATRIYISTGTWSEWYNGEEIEILALVKKNGKWDVTLYNHGGKIVLEFVRPLDCKKIENLPK